MIGSAVWSWEQGLNKSLKLFFFLFLSLFLPLFPYLSTTRPALRMKCSSLKRYRSNAETFSCSVSTSLWENEWIREEHFILSAVRVVLDCGLFFRGVIQHQTEREWKMFFFSGEHIDPLNDSYIETIIRSLPSLRRPPFQAIFECGLSSINTFAWHGCFLYSVTLIFLFSFFVTRLLWFPHINKSAVVLWSS